MPIKRLHEASEGAENSARRKGRPWKGADKSASSCSCRWYGCSEVFPTAKKARRCESKHIKLLESDAGPETAFQCQIGDCTCSFATANGLTKHLVVHGARNFKCQCGKSFSDNSKLKRHIIQIHSELYRFECEECSFRCFYSEQKKRHDKSKGHDAWFDHGVDEEKIEDLLHQFACLNSISGSPIESDSSSSSGYDTHPSGETEELSPRNLIDTYWIDFEEDLLDLMEPVDQVPTCSSPQLQFPAAAPTAASTTTAFLQHQEEPMEVIDDELSDLVYFDTFFGESSNSLALVDCNCL
jgi:hypothetical protein